MKYTIDNSWFFVPVDRAKEARRVARKARPVIGVTKKISDKRRKPPKHRKPLREED